MSACLRTSAERGVTLVELIVSIVVISVGLAGVLLVINRNVESSADPMIRQQAVAIAEAYLEEIETKSFTVGPGATRDTFDDIFDYHNLANNGCPVSPACPSVGSCICDQSGNAIPGLQGYVVSVSVQTALLHSITQASGNAALIQVTVTPPQGGPVTLSGYRTNYY